MNFSAIDFETANYYPHSACAIGLVKVENGKITGQHVSLIKPPHKWFKFTYIHGITYSDVSDAPTFDELWPDIQPFFQGIDFLTAHNAPFDRSVLHKTCEYYGINPPDIKFKCTVQLSRKVLGIYPTKLPDVCRALDINLDNHHEALSDALACARIMLHIEEKNFS